MLLLIIILLIRLSFKDDILIYLVDIFLWRIMERCVLFSVCYCGLLRGTISTTTVWVFHQSLNNFIFGPKLSLQELFVVLKNFIRLSLKVRISLINGFHKTINFIKKSGDFALYIALQSQYFFLIFPHVISPCRILGVVGDYIIWTRSCRSLPHWRTIFINILNTLWRRCL